jgi:hypothetical protein
MVNIPPPQKKQQQQKNNKQTKTNKQLLYFCPYRLLGLLSLWTPRLLGLLSLWTPQLLGWTLQLQGLLSLWIPQLLGYHWYTYYRELCHCHWADTEVCSFQYLQRECGVNSMRENPVTLTMYIVYSGGAFNWPLPPYPVVQITSWLNFCIGNLVVIGWGSGWVIARGG